MNPAVLLLAAWISAPFIVGGIWMWLDHRRDVKTRTREDAQVEQLEEIPTMTWQEFHTGNWR